MESVTWMERVLACQPCTCYRWREGDIPELADDPGTGIGSLWPRTERDRVLTPELRLPRLRGGLIILDGDGARNGEGRVPSVVVVRDLLGVGLGVVPERSGHGERRGDGGYDTVGR
jgi:hypothetical protein